MKQWKSLVSLLLTAALLLVGCGETKEPVTESVPETTVETTPETTETPLEETGEATEGLSSSAAAASLGVVEGNAYTNAYVGFGVEFDDSWVLLPAEELQEIPAEIQDMLAGTEMDEAKTAQTQIMDMQAQNLETGASVNVLYQGTDTLTRDLYSTMTDDQIADSVLAQKDQIIASYTQIGLDVSLMEKVHVSFLGIERVAIKTLLTTEDAEMILIQVFDFHLDGSFAVTTTFSALNQADLDALMASFHTL